MYWNTYTKTGRKKTCLKIIILTFLKKNEKHWAISTLMSPGELSRLDILKNISPTLNLLLLNTVRGKATGNHP